MIEYDLSRVVDSATMSTTNCVLGSRDVSTKVRRVLPSLFLSPNTTKRRKQSNPPKLTSHPIQSHPSTLREK
jgi:hypothetical protein